MESVQFQCSLSGQGPNIQAAVHDLRLKVAEIMEFEDDYVPTILKYVGINGTEYTATATVTGWTKSDT